MAANDRSTTTIRDVAREAGVAVSTVSRVLAGGYSSQHAQERVLQAVAALNYRPNQMARGLVRKESRTIGLVIPDITNPFFPALTRGVEDKARELGYAVLLANTDQNTQVEDAVIEALLGKQVDGLVVTTAGEGSPVLRSLVAKQFPLVVMDRQLASLPVHSVLVDNVTGARRGVEHLLALGHKRIAYIGGVQGVGTDTERMTGYVTALQAAGVRVDSALMRHGDYKYTGGYNAMRELLCLAPTAVFAANDLMALGALKAIREAGLNVPVEISVVGFDDIPMAEMTIPPLTTIRQPAYALGAEAADLLVKVRLGQPPPDMQPIMFQPELINRFTTAVARTDRR